MSKHHGMGNLKGIHAFCHRPDDGQAENRFGRLFHLPPLYMDPGELIKLGMKGGPMDGGTNTNRTNSVPIGHVFFGQFIDHDITLDITSSLSATADINEVDNVRTPALDLDCIYGLGPESHNYLYHNAKPPSPTHFNQVKLLTGAEGTGISQPSNLSEHDLCRTAHGTAIIGDPRNDENRIISQLQLSIIRFHNYVVDQLYSHNSNLSAGELFEEARHIVTWHYQWIVITDFLVKMCGQPVIADILGNGRRFYCTTPHQKAFIPIEFSVAAYRFGHSMIPQRIQIQAGQSSLNLFGTKLGRGFSPLETSDSIVDWNELVDAGGGAVVQMAEKLDSQLSETLLDLPFIDPDDINSLASRNLLRGQSFLLPSGENVAKAMNRPESEINTISNAAKAKAAGMADLTNGTPLWYYILVEAEEKGRETTKGLFDPGEGLGPVGARIVAETIIGLIELDDRSFLAVNRNWRPDDDHVGVKTLGEMLTYSFP